ncbi:MAG: hypothetical protein CVT59_03985 [Actinobacteria bacterium HGW-Actinobacteria-1]|jgi:hypothetical protein|nr:MAG: hypothetical protein CVT59_03985 [Actinobacteria bacterium HGW-Actinobacteria-1]
MHGNTLAGPGIIFFQVLTFVLVVGSLAMIVHALSRKADRWAHPWTRFIWVGLGAAWALALVFALIWRNDTTFTVVGIAFVVILVTEVAYLLRVVFPAHTAAAIPAEAPVSEPLADAIVISETTTEEQSPDA